MKNFGQTLNDDYVYTCINFSNSGMPSLTLSIEDGYTNYTCESSMGRGYYLFGTDDYLEYHESGETVDFTKYLAAVGGDWSKLNIGVLVDITG